MNSIVNIFFSPTGTTQKVGEAITSSFEENKARSVNLTLTKEQDVSLSAQDVAVIGMPVYRGLLPEIAIEKLKKISGDNTPCICYVVYGNRDYGQALLELKQLLSAQGFIPIAEGSFIGEHSFASSDYPIAKDRPDDKDLDKARLLGIKAQNCLKDFNLSLVDSNEPQVIERKATLRIPPEVQILLCDFCGNCVDTCPAGAITIVNKNIQTDKDKCITCMACLKACPQNARVIKDENLLNVINKLYESTKERRESEFLILI